MQLALDLSRRRALDCVAPVCQPPCGLHAVCPYARDAASTQFLQAYKRQRVLGPLKWFQGRWLETVMGCVPWGEHGAR